MLILLFLLIIIQIFVLLLLYKLNLEMNKDIAITEKKDDIPLIVPNSNGDYPEIPENKVVKIGNLLDYQFKTNTAVFDLQSSNSQLFFQ